MDETANFVLEFRDEKGRYSKKVTVNGLVQQWSNTSDLIHRLEAKISLLDLKMMNTIKIAILFHLEGLKEAIKTNGTKAQKQFPLYSLSSEIIKLTEAINHDLRYEYVNLYDIRDITAELTYIYLLIKQENKLEIVSKSQFSIIDLHFFNMISSFNRRVKSQIRSIKNDRYWLINTPARDSYDNLLICREIRDTEYEIDDLYELKIEYQEDNEKN